MDHQGESLCKNCRHRYRRVFIPLRPEEYLDEDGNSVLANEENIIITNQCLLTSTELDGDITIECDSYKSRDEKERKPITFFKHL